MSSGKQRDGATLYGSYGLRNRNGDVPPRGVESWEWAKEGTVEIVGDEGVFEAAPEVLNEKNHPHGHGTLRRFDSRDEYNLAKFGPSQVKDEDGKTSSQDSQATAEECGFVKPWARRLGQWHATSIAANDTTSSCLYTGGLVMAQAGYLAPFAFVGVIGVLLGYRRIYEEVISALPLNGATYSALMNTTRKKYACIAATLSVISYIATAVTSGVSAMTYLQSGLLPSLPIFPASCAVFVFFALLKLLGVKESSNVSLAIFLFHMISLSILTCCSIVYAFHTNWVYLEQNWHQPLPRPAFSCLIFGFAQSLLGVTGFETSANYVEDQRPGIFRKTLFNMWWISGFFNTVLAILAFAVMPPGVIYDAPGQVKMDVQNLWVSIMAKQMAPFVGGSWLNTLLIVDAVFVLSGAVFTAYVGSAGMIQRMVKDDCFPSALDARLPVTGSNWPVPILFCLVCISLYGITGGKIESIAGVYVLAFLSVMSLFAICNIIMKHTRSGLKRDAVASGALCFMCLGALVLAIIVNIIMDPKRILYLVIYFSAFFIAIVGMYARAFLLRDAIYILEGQAKRSKRWNRFRQFLIGVLLKIEQNPVVFFSRRLDIRDINKAVLYMQNNELTHYLKVVHAFTDVCDIPTDLLTNLEVLRTEYPTIRIDILAVQGTYGPGFVKLTEKMTKVPPNRMFIASPSPSLKYNVAELGGVRIIMGRNDRGQESPVVPESRTSKEPGTSSCEGRVSETSPLEV